MTPTPDQATPPSPESDSDSDKVIEFAWPANLHFVESISDAVRHREGTVLREGGTLSPMQRKFRELVQRREAGLVSPHDFDLNFIFQLNQINAPLTRRHLRHESGNQAVVLTRDGFDSLGYIDFIHKSGERIRIERDDLDKYDVLILYPSDLGDVEGQPYLQIAE